MATPTKNSADELESPIMYVVVTERLQRLVFPSTSGTWPNLTTQQDTELNMLYRSYLLLSTDGCWEASQTRGWHWKQVWRISPKRVVKVGIEGFVLAIATEESDDVLPWVSATASKSKYSRELSKERAREIRVCILNNIETKTGKIRGGGWFSAFMRAIRFENTV